MSGQVCAIQANGCALRLGRLASTYVPAVGANNMYTTDMLVDLTAQDVVNTGSEIAVETACGVYADPPFKNPDITKWMAVTLQVARPDAEFIEMLTAALLVATTGTTPLATPVISTVTTATTGGLLTAATYSYRVAAINATGETLPSAAVTVVVPGGTSTNANTVNWGAVAGSTGFKIYGRTAGTEQLIATVGVVTTYVDTGVNTPNGAVANYNSTSVGNTIGYGAPRLGQALGGYGVSLEVWSKRLINGAQAAINPWLRTVFPRTYNGRRSQQKWSNAAMPVIFEGLATENPLFGNGPAHDWVGPSDRVYSTIVDAGPLPTAVCGYQTTT